MEFYKVQIVFFVLGYYKIKGHQVHFFISFVDMVKRFLFIYYIYVINTQYIRNKYITVM